MASNRGLASVRSGVPESAGGKARRVARGPLEWLIIATFVAFVFSMPFELAPLLGGEALVSISKVLGYIFFGLALLQPRMCFRKPPRALWWFALYFGLYVILGLYQHAVYWPEISRTAFRLAQFLVLLWVGYNLFQYERVARWCFWGFGLASVAVATLLAGGVGVSDYHGFAGRQTVFGYHPNTIGSVIGLGAVALIGMAYGKVGVPQRTKLAAWAGFLIVAIAITRTGSRGALFGLALGLITLLAVGGSARDRLRNVLIVVLALGACVWITMASATSATRWRQALEEGSLSGRQRIYPAAIRMVREKPILGWGPVTNYYELGRRLNAPTRDMHNIFLWLLTEQGLVGTIPFCIGLAMCARAAWRGRRGVQGLLPLALLVAVLGMNLSATYHVTKWFWMILAYSLASETYVRRRRARSTLTSSSLPGIGLARSGTAASRSRRRPGVVSWRWALDVLELALRRQNALVSSTARNSPIAASR